MDAARARLARSAGRARVRLEGGLEVKLGREVLEPDALRRAPAEGRARCQPDELAPAHTRAATACLVYDAVEDDRDRRPSVGAELHGGLREPAARERDAHRLDPGEPPGRPAGRA